MKTLLLIQNAIKTLKNSGKQTLFTLLGILVGSMILVLVLSLGSGVESVIQNQLGMLTPDVIYIEVKVPDETKGGNALSAFQIDSLDEKDEENLQKISEIKAISGWYNAQETISYKNSNKKTFVLGTSYQYPSMQGINMQIGKYFSEKEDLALANKTVLGYQVATDFAQNRPIKNLIGEKVSIQNKKFEIIGILEEQGGAGFFNPDNLAYIPLKTGQKKLWGVEHVQAFMVQIKNIEKTSQIQARIEQLFRQKRKEFSPEKDDFAVRTYSEAQSIVGDITGGIKLLLGGIAGIALLVGGVGILNVMFARVFERIPEIGLRKAIGASPQSILFTFLTESVLLTGFGGILGATLGVIFSFTASFFAEKAGYSWQFVFPWDAIGIAVGFSVVLGILFGVFPAQKAAKLDPVESLRS